MVAAFRGPLQAALAGPQDADRPRTYAAAEVLAGLLASGALFAADAGVPFWRCNARSMRLMASDNPPAEEIDTIFRSCPSSHIQL